MAMFKRSMLALLATSASLVTAQKCADVAGNNGKVDIEDLLALLGAYGSSNAKVNLVGSNQIDIEDLLALLGQYGRKCRGAPPPPPRPPGEQGMYLEVYHYKNGWTLSDLENPRCVTPSHPVLLVYCNQFRSADQPE